MNNKVKHTMAIVGLSLMATSFVPMAAALATPKAADNVTFCHATDSFKNPYVVITTDPDSIFKKGHDGHNDPVFDGVQKPWGDIIPSFVYNKNGKLATYPGLNLGNGGSAILANGCNPVTGQPSPSPSVTVSPTATVTPSASVSPSPSVTPSATVTPTATPTATVSPSGSVSATATATATPTVSPSVKPPKPTQSPTQKPTLLPTVVPTVVPPVIPTQGPTSPAPVPTVPSTPRVLPHTGVDTDTMLTWSVIGIVVGGVMLGAGLRKPA